MATKFLDYTGLSYLWGKVKAWCNATFVHLTTDEDITGTKTFVGSKKIAFKQSGANDKLGFTLYNNSSKEQGYLEYNPTNKIANVPLFTLGNYATADNELSYIGFRRYSNISGASGAYNLLAPLISDAKTLFNLTTTYTNFYLPLGISDGTNIVKASNSGVIDISSLLSGFLTSTSTLDATKLSGTIPSSCYTDTTYTAGTGLSLSGTQFSLANHNQASNTINLLTGYSKPSTSSALATTDTLNQALGKLEAKTEEALINSSGVPVGTVIWLSTSTVPVGYLLCNGQAVGRSTYPDLFTAIGTTYGSGDGSTTFNLPNLIDKFIEGASTNIGNSIAAGLPNITGHSSMYSYEGSNGYDVWTGALETKTTNYQAGSIGSTATVVKYNDLNFNASKSNSIYGKSTTVQPPALKLLPCIKAYSGVSNLEQLDAAQLENELQNNYVYSNATYIKALSVSGKVITYTKGDNTIGTITTQDTTYSAATQSAAGLMSASDKKKLDGINTSAGMYTLKATWSKPSNGGQKTVTNCIIGKPLIVVHKPLSTRDTDVWCDIKVISGAINATADSYHHNRIGILESSCFVCIPTAATVTFTIWNGHEYDCLYVYD